MSTDINALKNNTKHAVSEVAQQAHLLATGLQNAAPPSNSGPGNSVLYLSGIAAHLDDLIRQIEELSAE